MFDAKTKKEVEKLRDYMVYRIINGPRDLIFMVTKAQENAVKESLTKITLQNIQNIENEFGAEKLNEINRNFQNKYKDIDYVIDKIFRNGNEEYELKDLENLINEKFLTETNLKWALQLTPHRLVRIFYEVGIIGYYDSTKDKYVYGSVHRTVSDGFFRAKTCPLP